MLGDWEYTEQEDEAIAEVKENGSKPSSLQHSLEETATQANANIAEGQELKVLPANNQEQHKVVEADSTIKSLPRATTTTAPMDKKRKKNKQPLRKQKQQQRKETAMPNISKQLHKQGIEIKKLKSILQSQSEVIKQLKSQLRQVTKQTSKIPKHAASNKKRK
jgi:hypothetical protein